MEYYLGLDLGTNSIGWAVTDEKYRIIRAKGKDLWGIREFERAETAEKRRKKRTSRRNRQRKVVRMGLIKSYFDSAISEVDPNFFARLENSKYYLEDKSEAVRNKNGIFNDKDYTDKEYYHQFPTVYHLIMELINNPNSHDVRLVYLAIANLFKRRGHFLNAGLSEENSEKNIQMAYDSLCESCQESIALDFPFIEAGIIEDILKDRNCSKKEKTERLMEILSVDKKNKKAVEIIKALTGRKVNAKTIFETITCEEKVEFAFSDTTFEDNLPELIDNIGEENFSVVNAMREVYDIGVLAGILNGHRFLSESRIADYEKHKDDLKILKKVVREQMHDQKTFNELFREDGNGSYSSYVKSSFVHDKHLRRSSDSKGRSREAFYKKVQSKIKDVSTPEAQKILQDIECEIFMPKMLTPSNGVIPNQVHLQELKAILANVECYLPFLKEKDESGLTVSERIIRLYKFRVPYYVGPVSNRDGKGNGWAVRKEDGPVLPWNISDKIDLSKTKEEFIERLIRRCTYLSDEKVLPDNALIYERFKVLNEINNIRINDERISVELKQDIYNDLFKKGKKVTRTALVRYLRNRGVVEDDKEISGIDVTINNSLSSYGKFKAIFGERIEEDSVKRKVEEIIKLSTIYGDDKKELKKILKERFGEDLDDNQIRRIAGYRFKNWGRMSRAFLEMEGADCSTGEAISIITALWTTQYNLMELIHSKIYSFHEVLQEKVATLEKSLCDIKAEDLNDYYFSSPVKRMTWQTILLIKEITKVLGKEPDRIFIEMTRTDEEKGDKGRKNSRAKDLLDLYKNVKEDKKYWTDLIKKEDNSGRLRSKKMYLYLRQMGKDMYTGETIDLDKLFDDNLYDIDHIYPRHFVKDNNLENNLVLVDKTKNSIKLDKYPLDPSIQKNPKVRDLWEQLRSLGLISAEKYRRLTSKRELTDAEKAGFIARQLVETSQATKGVADLLNELTTSEIIYSKAGNVSDFRHQFGIPKSRIANDFHHANDAYLNIVVGNVYYTKFTKDPSRYIKEEYNKDKTKNGYHLGKMFKKTVKRGDYTAWEVFEDESAGTIRTVKEMLQKTTPLMTRMPFVVHGEISDETIYGKNVAKEGSYLPIKGADPRMAVEKYGGFNKATGSYFFLVEHEVKGKRIRTIEFVPVYLRDRIENTENGLEKYCLESLGLLHPSIRLKQIKMQSLLKVNGYFVHLTGRTGKQLTLRNAVNMKVDWKNVEYIHWIEKYIEFGSQDERISEEKNLSLFLYLVEKQGSKIYRNRPNSVYEKLKDKTEAFKKLSCTQQCTVLYQMLNLTMIGKTKANLTLIGESPATGVMQIPKKITSLESVKLLNQSITGLYEEEIDLLTV
ncbi:CRISPR-associated endonuclease Csn1 [Lachnospiraceae bacterium KHCPX20]|nr:CRISPR-associated endonuclease Csn1 [Lachnospiraceae bacterium KHCPX20]